MPASVTNAVAVAAGANFSLALLANSNITVWGGLATAPLAATNMTAISAGSLHALALRRDGKVFAWGDDSVGQTNIPTGLTNVVAIAAGNYHNLALLANGTVLAWGSNANGQTNVPAGLTNVMAIAAGVYQSLALQSNGMTVVWGGGSSFPSSGSRLPFPTVLTGVTALSGAANFNLALLAGGRMFLNGNNVLSYTSPNFTIPPGATNLVSLATGTNFNLVLRADGQLFSWGMAPGTNVPSSATNVIAMAVGYAHGLAITNNGAPVLCGAVSFPANVYSGSALPLWAPAVGAAPLSCQWYANGVPVPGATNSQPVIYGQSGVAYQAVFTNVFGAVTSAPVSFNVLNVNAWGNHQDGQCTVPAGVGTPIMIAAGAYHCLALERNGTVIAWGSNRSGQTSVPATATNVVAVAAGTDASAALRGDGSVVEWGQCQQLVFTNQNYVLLPMLPANATNLVAIAAGWEHRVGLQSNGQVLAWGDNSWGQTNVPPYLTNVIAIAAGYYHNLALLANHTVAIWGSQEMVPPAATNVVAIAAGWEHSLALRTDGSIIAWGDNSFGQCNVPAQVTNAIAIAAGYMDSLAILSDGTVAAWGQNAYTTNGFPGGLSNVVQVACGEDHELAMVGNGAPQVFANNLPVSAQTGGSAILGGYAAGGTPLTCQWYQNGQAVPGATNGWLQLTNLNPANAGTYYLTAGNPAGTNTGPSINLAVSDAPGFTTPWLGTPYLPLGAPFALPVAASGAPALGYQWYLNGLPLSDGAGVSGTATAEPQFSTAQYGNSGVFSLVITNGSGACTGLVASLAVTPVMAWGDNSSNQLVLPAGLSNILAVAAGGDHSLALRADGHLLTWGDSGYGLTNVPADATNLVAIAAGDVNSMALRADGKVFCWGDNSSGQTNVPAGAAGAVQIATGATTCFAVMPNGSLVHWGSYIVGIPNVVAISARGNNSVALITNGHVYGGYGYFLPVTLPAPAIAVAAGANHGLALLTNQTVYAWGLNTYGQVTVPAAATNVVAIAAGDNNSFALRSDGTLIAWGYTNVDQTPFPAGLPACSGMAGGSIHNLALVQQTFSQTILTGGTNVLRAGNLGTGLGTLQWYCNGVPIADATNTTLPLVKLTSSASGTYQLMVSNPLSVTYSPTYSLTIPPFQFNPSAVVADPVTGAVTLQLTGAFPSKFVTLYGSTNPVDPSSWSILSTSGSVPASGVIQFTDLPPTSVSQRYYRALETP